MADVAEEDHAGHRCLLYNSLLVLELLPSSKSVKNERTQHGLNQTSERENHSVITQNK